MPQASTRLSRSISFTWVRLLTRPSRKTTSVPLSTVSTFIDTPGPFSIGCTLAIWAGQKELSKPLPVSWQYHSAKRNNLPLSYVPVHNHHASIQSRCKGQIDEVGGKAWNAMKAFCAKVWVTFQHRWNLSLRSKCSGRMRWKTLCLRRAYEVKGTEPQQKRSKSLICKT